MRGYRSSDVAKMLDLPVAQIRSYTRAGFLQPRRGRRGEYLFSFQDLVLLRTAKGLSAAHVPSRKIKRALRRLKEQLPTGRPLTAVQIAARGDGVVVRDGDTLWNPESGQTCFDFDVSELADKVAPLSRRVAREALDSAEEHDPDEWYELGCELEASVPGEAMEAYTRALEIDPGHADSHVNLGRLLHEDGRLDEAVSHYRKALGARPGDVTALFNLAVSLEDLGSSEEAIRSYREAIAADPECADAHYNLARLYERLGRDTAALRHFGVYRKLTRS